MFKTPDVAYCEDVTTSKQDEVLEQPAVKGSESGAKKNQKGIKVHRIFSDASIKPFDQVEWETRTAFITGDKGEILFQQDNVEVPKDWSMLATNIVASKYFYGEVGTSEREFSVKQLIHRVARTITDWGIKDDYFATPEDAETYYDELCYLCLNQYGAFNSPVWFNCGLYHQYKVGLENCQGTYYFDRKTEQVERAPTQYEYPQCSACFIQKVDDDMESILELAHSEALLFKFGSGSGSDLSTIRSSREKLSGGGTPSGPLSFLKVYDSIAGVIKSGGKTRRAAKMNTLKCWHPDIKEFIDAKTEEEKKAWALIEQGYDGSFNGDAYASVAFQNENLSIRVTDDFMRAVEEDKDWATHWVTNPDQQGPTYKARDLLKWIAEGTWTCGDPGIQYEDIINRWHTSKNTAPINSSNPCSEYMFIDNSACNLASLNLMKFVNPDGTYQTDRFKAAVEIFITAQEIIVGNASYPTKEITWNSELFRPLGLGYANLGSLIMSMGLPYGSDEGRSFAAALTSIMHFHAYTQSARLAASKGSFDMYEQNKEPMQEVMRLHQEALEGISESCPDYLLQEARACAAKAIEEGEEHGYRNAQVTVLAPTGTIGFLMDCDTTGIEPDIALVKYKSLAGGGLLKIVNQTLPLALEKLGYSSDDIVAILDYVDENDTIEDAPNLKEEHLPVFDCAFKPKDGQRSIHYRDHIRMMAAVQPFLSGAISKTVNLPNEATADDIMQAYIEGWQLGLKSLAIYRDGCKRCQPLNTSMGEDGDKEPASEILTEEAIPKPHRRRLPNTRESITHKFDVAGHEGYLTVGLYEDGSPGELFITMAKEGSTVGGLMDSFGTAISMCLQYGVSVKTLSEKFAHTRFEPSGFTKNKDIPMAKSLTDYIFRWLKLTFTNEAPAPQEVETEEEIQETPAPAQEKSEHDVSEDGTRVDEQFSGFMEDAPACDTCGAITVRNGACYRCYNCGSSMGCS